MLKILCLSVIFIASPVWALKNDNIVDVIAVEYPPFTTNNNPDGGIAFKLLNDFTSNNKIIWNPLFLPPKRAYKTIKSGNWCASFYPVQGNNNFKKYELDKGTIKIGLIQLAKPSPFIWSSLDELEGKSVAMLRTGSKSRLSMRFQNSNMNIVYVETIQAAIMMVILGRTDMAMIDNISFSKIESKYKNQLQLSKKPIFETQISIYINNRCDIPKLNLKVSNN
jgi:polar amino acid transport system substrate-binding protein